MPGEPNSDGKNHRVYALTSLWVTLCEKRTCAISQGLSLPGGGSMSIGISVGGKGGLVDAKEINKF